MKTFIYIHGFNSSSQSEKANQVKLWVAQHCNDVEMCIPDLAFCPNQAMATLKAIVEDVAKDSGDVVLLGSSLGGFYANYLSEEYNLRTVLVNPVVYPQILLNQYLGEQTNFYTGKTYTLDLSYVEKLKSLFVHCISDSSMRMVLLQTGDETLDYTEAADYYKNAQLIIQQGGDHGFMYFNQQLPAIANFLLLK